MRLRGWPSSYARQLRRKPGNTPGRCGLLLVGTRSQVRYELMQRRRVTEEEALAGGWCRRHWGGSGGSTAPPRGRNWRNLGGFFTGFDERFGGWVVGAVGGYTYSSVSVGARASSANIEAASLGVYAGTSYGPWNFRSGAAVTWDSVGTNRSIAFPGFFDVTTSHDTAAQGQAFGEIGYGVAFGNVAVEPFAGAAFVHLNAAGLTETGGLAALAGSTNREDVGLHDARRSRGGELHARQVLVQHDPFRRVGSQSVRMFVGY
jgi:outer membrane autotransporter protein